MVSVYCRMALNCNFILNSKTGALVLPPSGPADPLFRKPALSVTIHGQKFSRSDSSNSDEGVVADLPWASRTVVSTSGEDVRDCDFSRQDSPMEEPPEVPVTNQRLNMQIASNRLFSFVTWPVRHQSPSALSEAGFYYTGHDDMVQCAFCHKVLGEWHPNDIPMEEHARFYPNCPFVKTYGSRVPPEPVTPPSSGDSAGEDVCGWYFPCRNPQPLLVAAPPKTPQMALYTDRFATFAGWPRDKRQAPRDLASAGLYYTGERDKTACFHCGGYLVGWEEQDEPWTEHARNYPSCQFVIASKGQAFVDSCRRLNGENVTTVHHHAAQSGPEGYLLVRSSLTNSSETSSSGAPPSSQSSGFEDESSAFMSSQESESYSDRSAWDEEDEQILIGRTVIRNSNLMDAIQQAVAENRQTLNSVRFHSEEDLLGAAKAIQERTRLQKETLARDAEWERTVPTIPSDMESLTREYERLRKERTCKVCLDRETQVIFQPCGHMVCCSQCAGAVQTCPVCRKLIVTASRVYLS